MRQIKYILYTVVIILSGSLLFVSCKKDKTQEEVNTLFNRQSMLENFASNLIKPAYTDLQQQMNALKVASDAFIAAPDSSKLVNLQNAWDNTYSSWMYANAYNFGPAGEEGIRKRLVEEIGTWPANVAVIESNISANNTTLNDFNRDNRGLNAVDYLIFDINGNVYTVVNAFQGDANRGAYLAAIINKLKTQVDGVVDAWNGSYAADFINNNGTSVGSSTSQLYNEFVECFESIKNFKMGIPLGKRIGQTTTEPAKVEARYSRKSFIYLKLHLQAVEDMWHGKSKTGADGVGWKEYLASVTGGSDLIASTESQLQAVKNAIEAIPDSPSMEEQITSNFNALEALHTELQKHTRFFKSDMSSILGIAITYSSGDGD